LSQFIFKMPDLGEGTVEAEIVAWHTKPGDSVEEDQVIVEVMTDKAAVEVPAPVSGRVVSVTGEPGDKVAVGSPLIVFEVAATPAAPIVPLATAAAAAQPVPAAVAVAPTPPTAARTGRVMTSPANRRRALEAGIDLARVAGSGPGGRILRGDLVAAGVEQQVGGGHVAAETSVVRPLVARSAGSGVGGSATSETTEIKVIGLRRVIAERMSEAKRTIPHFAYVEEVDISELESLRAHLNRTLPEGAPTLSYLPFVVLALTRALDAFPQCNVRYDAAREVLVRHRAVHVGVATQTPDGLKVPVVRNAEALSLWELGAEIRRVAERARSNKATRDELMGSTITVTSLGKLGGIASTPVINAPEVAIIGLNKAVDAAS
jgi:2-oxoisovalerate dehydrogenase E2 component (dihydrolipoyl transacylase)